MASPRAVIAISSHVARGSVGNRAMVFALERLGFNVWAVPTVLLPRHPGHGPGERIVADDAAFARLLDGLLAGERTSEVAGIVSGYLASPEQAQAVAALVRRVKAVRPCLYLCDPVIGDAGRLYVSEGLAAAIRDELLPLADIATPNAFECAWLAGKPSDGATESDLAAWAKNLAPAVLVTSAPALMRGHIANLLVEGGQRWMFEHRAVATPAKGTGDLLAALLLARRLQGQPLELAVRIALSSVAEIVAGTAAAGADELDLAALQDALIQPRTPVQVRRLVGPSGR
jgi:pyridoxine kinase